MGFHVEAAHHEVSPGQHEIDFRYDDVLATADNISTFRFVVKNVALQNDLHATFMPKPVFGLNGSGMHTHQSLFRGDDNAFYDERGQWQLSEDCLHYIGGLLRHAKGFARSPTRWSTPTSVWSRATKRRRRLPGPRRTAVRSCGCRPREARPRASSCACPIRRAIPYLALAVMLRAGLDGIDQKIDPGPPVNKNIYKMSHRERRHLRIDDLPANLSEALDELEKDDLIRDTLGEHTFQHFVEAKREEWDEYIRHVSTWETRQLSPRVLSLPGLECLVAPQVSSVRNIAVRRNHAQDQRRAAQSLPETDVRVTSDRTPRPASHAWTTRGGRSRDCRFRRFCRSAEWHGR